MTKRATAKSAKAKAAPKKAAQKAKSVARSPAKAVAKAKPARTAAASSAKSPSLVAKSSAAKSAIKSPAKAAAKSAPASKPRTRAIEKTQDKKLTAKAGAASNIVVPPDYRPSEDEPFMSEKHRAYFRQKLAAWKDEIIRQTRETLAGLHEDSTQHADLADRATSETDRNLELRARDRQRKLIAKIDAALSRIEDGTYGYCEETGEPIGLKRLDARPIATLSVEAQERHERRERVYRED
jgi:DnaK suppressor protein